MLGSSTHSFQILVMTDKQKMECRRRLEYAALGGVHLIDYDVWERRSSFAIESSRRGYVTWRYFEAAPHSAVYHSSGAKKAA